jgi:hypothetical protein
MHTALNEYSLQLNPAKTRIAELPQTMDAPWRDVIRRFDLGNTDSEREKALLGYFDTVFSLKRQYDTDPVVSYAISRLDPVAHGDKSWKAAEALLLQALSVEPDAVQQVAVALAKAYSDQRQIDLEHLRRSLAIAIKRHAPQGHSFEVSWVLWMILSFGCTIEDEEAIAALAGMADSVVALLSLDAYARGLLPGMDLTHWATFMTEGQLYGEQWLLCYEAKKRGWLPSLEGNDYVAADAAFSFLEANGVNFYTRVRAPTRASIAQIPNWRPASYGDDSVLPPWLADLAEPF